MVAAASTGRSTGPAVPAVLADCVARFPDGLATGQAGWTTAGEMPARWVIHVVGPNFPPASATGLLTSCYANALPVADELGARTVAFPLVSRGDLRLAAPGRRDRRRPGDPPGTPTEVEEARLVAFGRAAYDADRRGALTTRVLATYRATLRVVSGRFHSGT